MKEYEIQEEYVSLFVFAVVSVDNFSVWYNRIGFGDNWKF